VVGAWKGGRVELAWREYGGSANGSEIRARGNESGFKFGIRV